MLFRAQLTERRFPRRVAPTDAEPIVSQFLIDGQDHCAHGGGLLGYVLGRPWRTLVTARHLWGLPVLSATTCPGSVEGVVIDRALTQRHSLRRFLNHASVLVLPRPPAQYAAGPRRQTVRRMVRKAQRAGITCETVDDPAERRRLIALFDAWERVDPHLLYRNPDASNEHCLAYRRWWVARSADGDPLLLSVTPVDGEWALLSYFRTRGTGERQSLARYLVIHQLADDLARDGVRYLFDETSPARLKNGLRHYQRMVGFRLFRVNVRPNVRPAPPRSST